VRNGQQLAARQYFDVQIGGLPQEGSLIISLKCLFYFALLCDDLSFHLINMPY
jgi:hypothetical protein